MSSYRPTARPEDRARADLVAGLVSVATGVPAQAILGEGGRTPAVVQARRMAIYLTHVAYGWPLERVAHALRRNRTSVGIACRRVEDDRDAPAVDARLEALTRVLTDAVAAAAPESGS